MPAPITLPLQCTRCQGAVTIQFDWSPRPGPVSEGQWICPYCHAEQRLGAIGHVTAVVKRTAEHETQKQK